MVGIDLSDRDYFKKAQETRDFVFSDYLFGETNDRPIVMAAYPVSAINTDEDAVVVAGINLDWLSKIMSQSRRPARHLGGPDRQRRHRAGCTAGPGQHDRPAARYRAAAVGDRRQGARIRRRRGLAFVHRRRRLQARDQLCPDCRYRSRA